MRRFVAALVAAAAVLTIPTTAHARLQCVTYARQVSNIEIRGNAKTWWAQAQGVYARGQQPRVGAVLTFKGTRAMPYGHVAKVARIVDDRHIVLDHANWSSPGRIEREAMAVDVSPAGDWSMVRVWHGPTRSLGLRVNPAFGFIYDSAPQGDDGADVQLATAATTAPASSADASPAAAQSR